MNYVIPINNDVNPFLLDPMERADYEVIPQTKFLLDTIGDEDDSISRLMQARSDSMPTRTWLWYWKMLDNHDEQVTFLINEKYKEFALEFKLRFG